jgi:2-polyprenyl-3-methyl-5-hydroxy-6-metoxy-1,4-benzoquinol methylase
MANFFLPENYQENPASSFDIDTNKNYWNPKRVKTSISYQWAAYQWANKVIKRQKIHRVADVGCGFACKLNELYRNNPNVEFWGIDQPNAIALCKKHYRFGNWLEINLEQDPVHPPKKFGLVISSDVIEHLGNPDILIKYLKLLVADDGYILVTTPERDILRGLGSLSSPNRAHAREWNTNEFTSYLKSHDLHIVEKKMLAAQKFIFERNYLKTLLRRSIMLRSMRYNQAYLLKVVEK